MTLNGERKPEWEDAEQLGSFYSYFKKTLQIKGYWILFGYAVCVARVIAAPSTPESEGEP